MVESQQVKQELEQLKAQYDNERKNMLAIKAQFEDKNNSMQQQFEVVEKEKQKIQLMQKQMNQRFKDIQVDKEKLTDIHSKLKAMKHQQQVKNEKLRNEEKALTELINKKTSQLQDIEKSLNTISERQSSQSQVDVNVSINTSATGGFGWVPDPANKDKNLAIQFLDYTLRGREFLKININEIKDMKQIGEGAAAEVYKADYRHDYVAVKKLKVQTLIKNGELSLEYQREIEALTHFSHPNLLLFMGATAQEG